MDLTQHFQAIWRRRYVVVLASILVAAAVYAWRSSAPPTYKADALLAVTSGRAAAGEATTQSDVLFLASTYAQLAKTRPVVQDALTRSGLRIPLSTALLLVSADASNEAGFIRLSATGPTVASATALSAGLADALTATVTKQQELRLRESLAPIEADIATVQGQLATLPVNAAERPALQARLEALFLSATNRQLRPSDRLDLVAPARAEPTPISPHPTRDAVLALLVAFVINAELAAAAEALGDRFRGQDETEEVARVTGLPVLARIPSSAKEGDEELLEAIRTLRTNLTFMSSAHRLRSLAIVSVDPESGKSFVARHLAGSLAAFELPVVLIDGDLRRPVLHDILGLDRAPGLSDLFQGNSVEDAIRPVDGQPNLWLLPAGSPVADPSALLSGNLFPSDAKPLSWAEMVIIDTPAGAYFADALAIASQCDGSIVVINAKTARRRPTKRLIDDLRNVGAAPLGAVINRSRAPSRSSQYYAKRSRGGTR
jgi:capsular exopolysaccharide synthesis family protein